MGVKVREKRKGSGVWYLFIDHKGMRKAKRIGDKKKALEAAKQLSARLTLGDDSQLKKKRTFLMSYPLRDYII